MPLGRFVPLVSHSGVSEHMALPTHHGGWRDFCSRRMKPDGLSASASSTVGWKRRHAWALSAHKGCNCSPIARTPAPLGLPRLCGRTSPSSSLTWASKTGEWQPQKPECQQVCRRVILQPEVNGCGLSILPCGRLLRTVRGRENGEETLPLAVPLTPTLPASCSV